MNFKDLEIKRSYISYGDENIAKALLKPALSMAKTYKRSVGYFSSSVFDPIFEGVVEFVKNKGHIQLLTSPKLSKEDIDAISLGYEKRFAIIENAFLRDFDNEIMKLDDTKLELLSELVARNYLDIKIIVTKNIGDYHDKLAVLEDFDGNSIVFYGSANSTINGYQNNYEKIRVVRSWIDGDKESVEDEINEFDGLWSATNEFVKVYSFDESIKKHVLEIIEHKNKNKIANEITLRDYQQEAIKAWVANGYNGFYVMATGTGKTWTAIYAAKELLRKQRALLVVCVPYKHLVQQWSEDLQKAMPKANIIKVSSENTQWAQEINEELLRNKYYEDVQTVIITTISSFKLERFRILLEKTELDAMLIVDEAHRFKMRDEWLHEKYKYMLGLSATPVGGTNVSAGDELMDFFGGRVFNLPIEKALGRYLVNYYYNPIYVNATENEEKYFMQLTQRMMGCFKHNVMIDLDNFIKLKRNRLRIISMAEEKNSRANEIMSQVKEKDHFIVYCGDGHLFDDAGNELRHIQFVKGILDSRGYRPSQFTASENMVRREELVDAFNNGEITALAAIRCLDEGINIPSIKGALIMSSNDDYREFIQRRGRILRQYGDKKTANIYDVIVIPSSSTRSWALIELRRYYEYARLALNRDDLIEKLEIMLLQYGYTIDDVVRMDESYEEDNIDE